MKIERLTHKARHEAGYKVNRDVKTWECIDKLGKLEDLEEKNLLVKLPCKVGDVVYDINHGSKIELTVIGFRSGRMSNDDEDDELFQDEEWRVECEANDGGMAASVPLSELGKTVFLTEKDAKQSLKEMEGTK